MSVLLHAQAMHHSTILFSLPVPLYTFQETQRSCQYQVGLEIQQGIRPKIPFLESLQNAVVVTAVVSGSF